MTTEEAFNLYLANEGIVLGVLRDFGINWNHPDYDDFKEEGILEFVKAAQDEKCTGMGYITQSIRWHLNDLRKFGNRKESYEEEVSAKEEESQIVLTSDDKLLVEEVMKVCDADEKRLVMGILQGESITDTSKQMHMHRSKIYRMRDNLQVKLESVLAA